MPSPVKQTLPTRFQSILVLNWGHSSGLLHFSFTQCIKQGPNHCWLSKKHLEESESPACQRRIPPSQPPHLHWRQQNVLVRENPPCFAADLAYGSDRC